MPIDIFDRIDKALDEDPILNFGAFRLEKPRLGRGQQSVVYRVHNDLNRPFALKLIHPTDKDAFITGGSVTDSSRK